MDGKSLNNYSTEEYKAYLNEKGITFAPEAKYAELKELALANKKKEDEEAHMAQIKEELTAKGITFAPEATIEELEAELAKANTPAEEEYVNDKIPEGYVQIRNESNRSINGVKPWRIATIKEENLAMYQSYGCSLYKGQPLPQEQTKEEKVADKNLPPHKRK